MRELSRRSIVVGSAAAAALWASACDPFRPLFPPDINGLRLPWLFTSRVLAVSDKIVSGTGYRWHQCPDGGATFPRANGGWIYVSNAELGSGGKVSALVFNRKGKIVDAYQILSGTSRNCAGGPTPWGTWLSCEEVSGGLVWECNPYRRSQGIARPALGAFVHEAAAVNPANGDVYLTEDDSSGNLYRFRPNTYGDLSSGTLSVYKSGGGWTRPGSRSAKKFNRGEGCWWDRANRRLVFATTGDNSIWEYKPNKSMAKVYSGGGDLTQPDNVCTSDVGVIYATEDNGNYEIVLVREDGTTFPVVRLPAGPAELTGVCFTPDNGRMIFSAQHNPGVTYEVSGPWVALTDPGPLVL